MTKGFYSIMLAQFLSSLADNALLIAAIALLTTLNEPAWMTPLLKLFFVVSYVIFAAWVGIFADSMPKGRVMFITNAVKTVGCIIMLFGTHPLLAYAIVGLGAAAYSPAKYGILTELLPPEKLVKANGWIEGLTVASIILGTGLGGLLISPMVDHFVQGHHVFGVHNAAQAAIAVMIFVYAAAAAVNLLIPDTGARYPKQDFRPIHTLVNFGKSCSLLWHDKLGQISLSVTTLFWGAGATLQFLVLAWADSNLGLDLSKAAILQGVCVFTGCALYGLEHRTAAGEHDLGAVLIPAGDLGLEFGGSREVLTVLVGVLYGNVHVLLLGSSLGALNEAVAEAVAGRVGAAAAAREAELGVAFHNGSIAGKEARFFFFINDSGNVLERLAVVVALVVGGVGEGPAVNENELHIRVCLCDGAHCGRLKEAGSHDDLGTVVDSALHGFDAAVVIGVAAAAGLIVLVADLVCGGVSLCAFPCTLVEALVHERSDVGNDGDLVFLLAA